MNYNHIDAKDSNLYSNLFAFTAEQAQKQGFALQMPNPAFVQAVAQHPNLTSLDSLEQLEDEAFLYAIFWSLLRRLPEKAQVDNLIRMMQAAAPDRRHKMVALKLVHSLEGRIKRAMFVETLSTRNLFSSRNFLLPLKRRNKFLDWFYFQNFNVIGKLYKVYYRTLRPAKIFLQKKLR